MKTANGEPYPSADQGGIETSVPKDAGTESDLGEVIALSRICAAVSGLIELDAILHIGLDNVLSLMGGAEGGILLLDEKTKTLSYSISRGLSSKFSREVRLKPGEGIVGRVVQSGRPVLLGDISIEPGVARPDLVSMEGIKSFAAVPLRAKDNVLGVMTISNRIPHRFTRKDLHLLQSIGDLLGLAIEQGRLYEQLSKGRERYRQLARQVLIAQEEERKRIARELHDETSQTLAGLALNLRALMDMTEMVGIQDREFKSRLEKAHGVAVQVSIEVSRLIARLRPTLLDTLGLIPAIRQYAETSLSPLGVSLRFSSDEPGKTLPPEFEMGVFRWAQGAIGNIVKHSHATSASIAIKREGDELVVIISDNGQGFDVSQLTGIDQSGRGAGVFSMKERIRLLGGDCSIQSQPGKGTTLTARVPLS
ncbi:MAG: GAF domain-containing sensor histidine kinase [Chloroflexota bacterium]